MWPATDHDPLTVNPDLKRLTQGGRSYTRRHSLYPTSHDRRVAGFHKIPCNGKAKPGYPDIRVAMRDIGQTGDLEPDVRVYDTSGPYSDPDVTIDIKYGLAPLRHD